MALLESSGGSEEIIFEKTSRLKSRVSVRSLTEPGATRAICCKRYGNLAVAEPMRSCYCRQLTCTSVHHVTRSEEHTSELQSRGHLVCRLLLEKKKKNIYAPSS